MMIPDFKTYIKESLWSDIQDRSGGSSIREEDDINNLEYDDFLEYLKKTYVPISSDGQKGIVGNSVFFDDDIIEIYVPLCDSANLTIEISKEDNSIISMSATGVLFKRYTNLEEMLKNDFTLHTISGSSRMYIRSNEKPNNTTCLKLIDLFLSVVDDPILKNSINK